MGSYYANNLPHNTDQLPVMSSLKNKFLNEEYNGDDLIQLMGACVEHTEELKDRFEYILRIPEVCLEPKRYALINEVNFKKNQTDFANKFILN